MSRPALRRRRSNNFSPKNSYARTIERVKIPNQKEAHQHLAKKLAGKAIGKKPDDSDDSDRVVVAAVTPRSPRRQEIYASGGVAKGDTPNVTPRRSERSRRLREDTEEIVSERSRASSRASSDTEGGKKLSNGTQTAKTRTGKLDAKQPVAKEAPREKKQLVTDETGKKTATTSVTTPAASVLGAFKPRKRQASILQLIDHDNSSAIDSDDEREFLPDEISTPANTKLDRPLPTSASSNKTYSSLKRKRDSLSNIVFAKEDPVAFRQSPRDVTNLVEPTRTQKRKLSMNQQRKQLDDESIMAPPESSDEDGDDREPAVPQSPVSAKKSQPLAPTTEQLRSLMPSRKQKPSRTARNVFEIPENSQQHSDEISDDEDHSIFRPSKRRRPAAKSKAPPGKTPKANASQAKSPRTSTPSPVKLRTPMPLPDPGTPAKSSLKQVRTPLRDKSNTTGLRAPSSSSKARSGTSKRYGGSRNQQNSAVGQENDIVELEDEYSNEKSVDEVVKTEGQKWKDKWADIDDFEMVFEDVSMSTRSSSPMAR